MLVVMPPKKEKWQTKVGMRPRKKLAKQMAKERKEVRTLVFSHSRVLDNA